LVTIKTGDLENPWEIHGKFRCDIGGDIDLNWCDGIMGKKYTPVSSNMAGRWKTPELAMRIEVGKSSN
jgi:hypothetical protein